MLQHPLNLLLLLLAVNASLSTVPTVFGAKVQTHTTSLPSAGEESTPRFSTVFASHMVLQRGQPIELWGFGASPSASDMTVQIGSAVAADVYWPVGADGSWRAVLPAIHGFGCNGSALVLRSGGQVVQTLADICIGDVYLFSGQSNIDLAESYANQFDAAAQTKEEAFADANPDIRLMVVCPNPSHNGGTSPPFTTAPAKELADVPDDPNCGAPFDAAGKYTYCQTDAMKWVRANGTNIRGFSATAWFTGAALRKAMPSGQRVPIGLVRSSAGGTKIRLWSSADAIAKCKQGTAAPPGSTTVLFSNMILPFTGLNWAAVTWYQGESDVGAYDQSFFGAMYYSCAFPAMLDDWRSKLQLPSLPFLVVELAAYCNEHGASTFHSWCDQNTSDINTTDINLPALRLVQSNPEHSRPLVFMVTAADLGSVHPLMGSIHPAAKQELGARLALAAKAAAIAVIKQDWTAPPSEEGDEVIWEGPRLRTAYVADGNIEVVFETIGGAGLALNASAACPPAMMRSPLGRMSCNGAGFQLDIAPLGLALVQSATIKPGSPNTIVLRPHVGQNVSAITPQCQCAVKYAYADWPVCSVRNAKPSGGSTTVPLPARIFQLSICGTDRCPGIMCSTAQCPTTTSTGTQLVQKTGDGVSPDDHNNDGIAATIGSVGSGVATSAVHDYNDDIAAALGNIASTVAARRQGGHHHEAEPEPEELFIPTSSPACWYTGRTQINPDGSRSFDWEGTQLWVNIMGASYVKMVINATGGILGRFAVEVNGLEVTTFYVGGGKSRTSGQNTTFLGMEYVVVDGLARTNNVTVRVINILEPQFTGAGVDATFTLLGWKTDGKPLPASQPRARKIELVGDSISAGYGSRGSAALHNRTLPGNADRNVCPVTDMTSGNLYTYNWQIAEHFNADLAPIAWSGKGMFRNCCDLGERMPAYWLQTLGGGNYTTDWDHSRFVPDVMIINLGTNDAPGQAAGLCPLKNFSDSVTGFVLNAMKVYNRPKLPVFVAQGPMNCGEDLRIALSQSILDLGNAGATVRYLNLCGPVCDGCGGHPGQKAHADMAAMAIPEIADMMGW